MRGFEVGDRVRIVGHHEWPDGTTGTIALPEEFSLELAKPGEWLGHRRTVMGRRKLIVSFYLEFDRPTDDGSGDGPYPGAEVESQYLRVLK